MRYLITGTAGFIGFHLARRLLEEGHSVTGFDGMTAYYNLRLKEARHAALAQFPAFRPYIGMLEDEGAASAIQGAADQLQGDVTGRAFDGGSGAEHLPLAGRFEVAVKLFVEEQPAERAARGVVGRLGNHFDIERSGCVIRHDGA